MMQLLSNMLQSLVEDVVKCGALFVFQTYLASLLQFMAPPLLY